MKIMITILRKNGECRTWTNASAEEHLVMSLTAYAEGVKDVRNHGEKKRKKWKEC